MVSPINFKLIAHPMNWLIILLMVIIAGTFGHLFLSYLGIEPATKQQKPSSGLVKGNPSPVMSGSSLAGN